MDAAAHSPFDLTTALVAERTCFVIPTNLDWIEPTVDSLCRGAIRYGVCDEQSSGKVAMAFHEALVNAIIHGNLGISSKLKEEGSDAFAAELARRSSDPIYARSTVRVDIDYDGECCRWQFTDQGSGFDYEKRLRRLEEPPNEEEMFAPSGRGLLMMRAFTDDVHYDLGGRRVQLTIRKRRQEVRQHPRVAAQHKAQMIPVRADGSVNWEAAQEAVAHNLSSGGVGLFKKGLAKAERVLIGLDVEGRTIYLPAEVRRCANVGPGVMEIGCRFQLPSPQVPKTGPVSATAGRRLDDLLALLQSPHEPKDERRAHQRVQYTERVLLRTDDGRLITAFARNLSRSGIAVITTIPVEATPKTLAVLLPQREGAPLAMPAQVVRCRPIAGGFYDVAAIFLTHSES